MVLIIISKPHMNPQPQDLESFVSKIISEKPEFSTLEADIQNQIKADLLDRAEQRVKAVILANISPADLEAFQAINETGTDDEVQQFCLSHIPDLPELIASELLVFRNTYLA